MSLSKSQIDLLGVRLKGGAHSEDDLRLLDEYRRSYGESFEVVVESLRNKGMAPTGRQAKSTESIVAKLRRESIRLTQMQDIAGCRIVLDNLQEQDESVSIILREFSQTNIIDRRKTPSHGYRAVHIVATVLGKPIEIQLRSTLQHLWAEVSEKSADVLDPALKYGGGVIYWQGYLTALSQMIARYESWESSSGEIRIAVEEIDVLLSGTKTVETELPEEVFPGETVLDSGIQGILNRTGAWEQEQQELQELKRDFQEQIRHLEIERLKIIEMLSTLITMFENTDRDSP